MKTRSIFRRLRLPVLSAAAMLGLAGTASAQNPSIWSGGGGNGNWNNAANWDVLPASGVDTELTFAGTTNLNTINNFPGTFNLTAVTLDTGAGNTTISGNPLSFAGGVNPAAIFFNIGSGTNSRLLFNTDVTFTTPVAWTIGTNANNPSGAELWFAGKVNNPVGNTITLTTDPPAGLTVITGSNNTNFNGTLSIGTNALVQLGNFNAMWRSTIVTLSSSTGLTSGTTTAAGYGVNDAGYNQQIGQASGSGQFLVGTTNSASTVLLGFTNANTTLGGNAGLAGFNSGSHFGKVGTGVLTVSGQNASLNMGMSIRQGTMLLSGATGALVNSEAPGAISVYSGGQLRLNNTTAPGSISAQGRISDTALVRLAGGTFRLDGPSVVSALGQLEQAGSIRPLAGQSVIVVNANAAQSVALNFVGVTADGLARGGQVAFAGTALGSAPAAGVANITFTTAPTTVNGIIPFGLSQTGYTGSTTAATNAFLFNALAELGPNGVRPLSTFADNDFASATQNVRVNAALPAVTGSANSLTFVNGSIVTTGPVAVTSGAVFASGTSSVSGTGSLTTTGRMYLNSGPNAVDALTVSTPIAASSISKGGSGIVTVGTLNLTGTSPIISVNSGTLAFTGPVTVGGGAPIYQVAGGGTISGLTSVTGTLRGNGTVNGPINMNTGSLLGGSSLASDVGGPTGTTGAAPGTLTVNGTLSFTGGANTRLRFYLSSVFGGLHTQGLISVTTLDLTNVTPGAQLTIQPHSIDLKNNDTAPVYDFNTAENYTWTLVQSTNPIVGFNPAAFNVDLANFSNSAIGNFSVGTQGNNLVLNFVTTIPEPSILAVAALGLVGMARLRRKA